MPITCVFFDYGGVLAEEGFLHGLHAIAVQEGRDPHEFFAAVRATVFETGYLVGRASEMDFWDAIHERLGITRSGLDLRCEILDRFRLRPAMLDLVRVLRHRKIKVAILSDQTNWLDELEARDGFFGEFDRVFNSFHYGYHKGQREFFEIALRDMDATPATSLFIDDQQGNIDTARAVGLHTIHFTSVSGFFEQFAAHFEDIPLPKAEDAA